MAWRYGTTCALKNLPIINSFMEHLQKLHRDPIYCSLSWNSSSSRPHHYSVVTRLDRNLAFSRRLRPHNVNSHGNIICVCIACPAGTWTLLIRRLDISDLLIFFSAKRRIFWIYLLFFDRNCIFFFTWAVQRRIQGCIKHIQGCIKHTPQESN